ncbi:major facilitator superfamily MFS_1 [Kribbella flavida DSM 17836]|uniref:Major facilitator superfamily MFS_1 n=1 Tax=Kribbella flavida (strain DSM 17836 / JCM 10339 / NBRC 14399) TaxID=479435 RepID=D2PP09_KRIFD|nr:MFS transporter [Kribbella flavida]ADB32827.1 major facilitator superfamily MFS_1 [Kribbella flavida DSM 17836]
MLMPYVHLMRRPGAAAFCAAGILGRMPISMIGLGIVILIAEESGSYGLAGAVSGVAVVAGAITGPVQGRLVDRFGQRTLLLVGSVVCTVALAALLVAVRADAPTALLYLLSFVAGGTRPQVGSFVRARWTHLLGRGRALQTAFALEAVGDEVVFIVGPVLVTALATQVSPYAALGVAGLLGLGGGIWLALLRRSDPPGRGKSNGTEQAPLPWLSLLLLSVIGLGLGATLGSAEVVTIAFTAAEGQPGMSGVVLAVWAFGSLLAGLWYGSVHWRAPVERRLLIGTILLAISLAPLPWVGSTLALGGVLFCAGLTIAPTMVAVTACVEEWVPPQRLTEAITWTVTGILFGVAPGNALAGHAVDRYGASSAYWVPVGIGVLCAVVAACSITFARPKTRFAHN